MNSIFIQLAAILGLASVLGLIVHKLRLPLLIAYLLGGLTLAVLAGLDISRSPVLSFLPDIGIAFVLFLVGMELDLREIKSFGRQILVAGTLQVITTSTLGTFLAQSFGFSLTESIYLGIGLSFSSTIVVVKLLSDRKDLSSLYGKLSLGVLLLEDLLAVVILLGLTSSNSFFQLGFSQAFPIASFFVKAMLLFVLAVGLNRLILVNVFKVVSDSGELLFLTALAWCFIYISVAQLMGFSILIGAFLAGMALASSPYHYQIGSKIKPLRDFFVALFFVYLGTRVNFADLLWVYPLILVFSLYAVAVKPLIFLITFGLFGFRKHTMFHTAVNLSQVSEFSLIILLVGLKMGIVSQAALTTIALSGVLSIVFSSLMISRSGKIYKFLSPLVGFFERGTHRYSLEAQRERELKDHVVVIGAHRVGGEIVRFLKREGMGLVVLDFNPRQVELLLAENIPVIYGDMGDPEVLDILKLDNSKLIISTSPDVLDNKVLLEDLKTREINVPVIVRAETIKEAKSLYKAGADYVIIPDILAGDLLVEKLRDHLFDKSFFRERAKIELEKLSRKVLAWG